MKYLVWLGWLTLELFALDENDVNHEIQNSQNMEELTTHMQRAPRQYRHRYIQAIKERARVENETKREQLLADINAEKNETTQPNTLSGKTLNSKRAHAFAGGCNGNGKGGR